MKIIVLTKYSMDISEIRVDAATHTLRLTGVPQRFGDVDKGALEAAVRLKETSAADAVIEVLCFGPALARGAVKDLLAMGADEATVVEDPYDGAADARVAVLVLEAALRKLAPFDLVLCGFASDDGYSYQTGPRLAERMDLPLISYASEISLDSGTLMADRDLERGLQTVSSPLPAIVSVAEEAFLPRGVTLLQAMRAQKKPTKTWTIEDLGLERGSLDDAFECVLVSEAGVVVNRRQLLLMGQGLAEMADKLIDTLVDDQVLVLEGGS